MVKYPKIINNIKVIIVQFLLLKLILGDDNECEREKPIKIGTECLSKNCSQEQFDFGECIISNSIIRTQWLNNIIIIGDKDFRYINFMTTSKGEMIINSVSYPSKNYNIFYGINSKGKPLFNNSNNNNNYIIKKTTQILERYESEIGLLKITGDTDTDKEYLISFGRKQAPTIIFDFQDYEKNLIEINYQKTINVIMDNYLGSLISLNDGDKNYYIIGLIYIHDNIFKCMLIKFYFYYDNNGDLLFKEEAKDEFLSLDRKIISCYLKNNNIIVCMYVTKDSKYSIIFLDTNLSKKDEKELSIESPTSTITFFKFFHLKDDIDIFTYYQGLANDFPIIQIIETTINENTYSINLKYQIFLN